VRRFISQNGPISSVGLLEDHWPAESSFPHIDAGQLMFLGLVHLVYLVYLVCLVCVVV